VSIQGEHSQTSEHIEDGFEDARLVQDGPVAEIWRPAVWTTASDWTDGKVKALNTREILELRKDVLRSGQSDQ
jgi:hypothetical protein